MRDLFVELDPNTQVIELPVQDAPLSVSPDSDIDLTLEEKMDEPARFPLFRPDELETAIMAALREGPLGISEMAAQIGCGTDSIRALLNMLRESGRVKLRGQKRGARWCLPSPLLTRAS